MSARTQFLRRQYQWMIGATTAKDHPDYPGFGQVGITVLDEWRASFEAFAGDVEDSLPRALSGRRIILKSRQRTFAPDTIEWGFDSKREGIRKRPVISGA